MYFHFRRGAECWVIFHLQFTPKISRVEDSHWSRTVELLRLWLVGVMGEGNLGQNVPYLGHLLPYRLIYLGIRWNIDEAIYVLNSFMSLCSPPLSFIIFVQVWYFNSAALAWKYLFEERSFLVWLKKQMKEITTFELFILPFWNVASSDILRTSPVGALIAIHQSGNNTGKNVNFKNSKTLKFFYSWMVFPKFATFNFSPYLLKFTCVINQTWAEWGY